MGPRSDGCNCGPQRARRRGGGRGQWGKICRVVCHFVSRLAPGVNFPDADAGGGEALGGSEEERLDGGRPTDALGYRICLLESSQRLCIKITFFSPCCVTLECFSPFRFVKKNIYLQEHLSDCEFCKKNLSRHNSLLSKCFFFF